MPSYEEIFTRLSTNIVDGEASPTLGLVTIRMMRNFVPNRREESIPSFIVADVTAVRDFFERNEHQQQEPQTQILCRRSTDNHDIGYINRWESDNFGLSEALVSLVMVNPLVANAPTDQEQLEAIANGLIVGNYTAVNKAARHLRWRIGHLEAEGSSLSMSIVLAAATPQQLRNETTMMNLALNHLENSNFFTRMPSISVVQRCQEMRTLLSSTESYLNIPRPIDRPTVRLIFRQLRRAFHLIYGRRYPQSEQQPRSRLVLSSEYRHRAAHLRIYRNVPRTAWHIPANDGIDGATGWEGQIIRQIFREGYRLISWPMRYCAKASIP